MFIERTTSKPNTRKKSGFVTKRKKLIGKHHITVVNSSLVNPVLNYISGTYNTDLIKEIIVLGDGASHIKTLANNLKFHKNMEVKKALDHYHFKQAIKRISTDKFTSKLLIEYILDINIKGFNLIVDSVIHNNYHRKEYINKQRNYIINHYKEILYLFNQKLSCPMESQISHVLADRFTSRPKGFGDKTIKKLLKLRILKENNKNIIKAYLGNFNKDKIITINKPVLNWSMFNPRPSTVTIGKKATISVAQRY